MRSLGRRGAYRKEHRVALQRTLELAPPASRAARCGRGTRTSAEAERSQLRVRLRVRFRVCVGFSTPERVRQKAIEDCGKRVVSGPWRAERVHANLPQTALAHLLALGKIGQPKEMQRDSHCSRHAVSLCGFAVDLLWFACLVAAPCGAVPAVHTHRRTWRQERALNTQ